MRLTVLGMTPVSLDHVTSVGFRKELVTFEY